MSKKTISIIFSLVLVISIVLAGCSKSNNTSQESTPAPSQEPSATQSQEPAATAESDPDDGTQKLKITLMENGWVNQSPGDNDPIKQWIDKKYNVDFKLMNIPEDSIEQKLLLAFSTSDHPDIIFTYSRDTLQKLVQQGVVIADWTPYLEKIPTRAKVLTDERKELVTIDGKITLLPVAPEAQSWSLMVRKDWMANLGLTPPKTDVEFYEMLKKFTFDDPDKDGKDNTWGISSAGNNTGIGEIYAIAGMFGPISDDREGKPSFYIGSDGKLTNNILTGNHQKFLDFIRNAVKDKIIDPDWYTQEWGARQGKTYWNENPYHYGVAWYPPLAIVSESETRNKEPGTADQQWIDIEMPKGSDVGGQRPSQDIVRGYITISKAAADDPVRLSRVLKILEDTAFPNPGHFALKEGEGVEGLNVKLVDMGGGNKYWWPGNPDDPRTKDIPGAYDYGTWLATDDHVFMGSSAEPNKITAYGIEMNDRVAKTPSYENLDARLVLDPQVLTYLEKFVKEFNIQYILGKTDDYEGFKQNWLKQGGQKLMDQANEQLGIK